MPIQTYQQLLDKYSGQFLALQARLRVLSVVRLALFVLSIITGYYYFKTDQTLLILVSIPSLVGFLVLIRIYDNRKRTLDVTKALKSINQTEIDLLNGSPSSYEDGSSFIDVHHPYSYDLDLFGQGSLYQYLNRTTTSFGRNSLSENLLHPETNNIINRQHAIDELSQLLDFRQQLQASGIVHSSEEKKVTKLKSWLKSESAFTSKTVYYLLLIFPLAATSFLLLFLITDNILFRTLISIFLVINLGITLLFTRKMMSYISVSTDINKTLLQFSDQLVLIEKTGFKSALLQQLQAELKTDSIVASQSIKALASRFNYLDYLFNIFVSPLLNGFFLFHIHILFSLEKWKEAHGKKVLGWLEAIGKVEALNSFAGMHFNNKDFSFPELSSTEDITAVEMGHPLIRSNKRICNDISFRDKKFVVLTGSNMSGKSTFLRTLGINLVLARAGSSVCAKSFRFFPYDVYVSMRINDSLQDSESLFYAELKRLKTIIEHLSKGNKTFIILDEILRGTNSNDKHSGTVGLIHQLVSKQACGIIATHDLSVADLAREYPSYVSDKCFESEIINDELIFDYKIKEGVCTKLSASFLMKKLGIIK